MIAQSKTGTCSHIIFITLFCSRCTVLLRLLPAGVNQQPPMHQLRMRSFKPFWDEPKTHPLPFPRDFSAPFSAPKFTPPTYLPHLISHSLNFQSSVKLLILSSTELHNTRLEEGGELNARGILHPKCRSERRKVNSLPSLKLFFFYVIFFCLRRRRQHCLLLSHFLFPTYLPPPPTSYLPPPLVFLCAIVATKKATAKSYRCLLLYV